MNHALMNEICRDNNSYQNNEVTYYELASEVAEKSRCGQKTFNI